jgi:tetratricopeptide (TPR) repeat protein
VTAAVAVAIVATSVAPTQASDDPAAAEAKRHYEEGTKAFNLGEYPRAIAEFKATYNAKPDPLLLYNIAQSYRLAGDASQGLFFYKSFLRNMPDATNRKEVEAQIRKLEKQLADQKNNPTGAPPPVVVPPPTTAVPGPPPPSSITSPPAPGGSPPVTPPPAPTFPPADSEAQTPPVPAVPAAKQGEPPFAHSHETQVDLSAPSPPPVPADEPERPFYKKWWFWAGTAGVVILLGGIAAANANKEPTTSLGTYDPIFR